ncbi:uncharacterized protein LOC113363284 [Ctenocephalides felis]|nr:uncharacterized protein LOC113363284 [Ctenocephalides felis]
MLKASLFVMYGATSSLLPYLTIHMQSIGLTVEEIAIIYLALPFTTFLSPPITGFLVDKFGKYKPVVIMTLLLNAVFHHSLLFIPHQETPGVVPDAYIMKHPEKLYIEVWWSPCPSRECPEEEVVDLVVDQCVEHCLLFASEEPENPLAGSKDILDHGGIGNVSEKGLFLEKDWKNDSYADSWKGEIEERDQSKANGSTIIQTSTSDARTFEDAMNYKTADQSNTDDVIFLILDMHSNLGEPIEHLGIEIEQDENDTSIDYKHRFGEQMLLKHGVNVSDLEEKDLRCGGTTIYSNKSNNHLYTIFKNEALSCIVQKCRFRKGGPEVCPPDYKESDDQTFWVYFALRFFGTTMLSAGVTIMDPIALMMIEKYGGDFGRERLFSSIGMAIFSPITGFLIDLSSKSLGYTDYSAAFYTYDTLLVISAITVFLMPLGEKLPADNIFKDFLNLVKMPHVILFILFLFVLGNFWGFIESFLFLYLKELGAPNYLLGITVTVGTLSSLPFLYGAEKITKIFGHVNLIVIAFLSHAVRLVGYSFIDEAWWCFPFEALEALSCHLMWVAAATYCAILAPKNLLATLIGVLGMAHFSLGRGSGSFAGGFLIGTVGTRESFRYMGLMAVAGGLLYKLLHVVWLRKVEEKLKAADNDCLDNGENEKLQSMEPTHKDQSTMVSVERLSLMIKYNQIGSLTSLPRGSKSELDSYTRSRRSSYNPEFTKGSKRGNSASKVDLLKSALEIDGSRMSSSNLLNKTKFHSGEKFGQNNLGKTVLGKSNAASAMVIGKLNKELMLETRAVSAPKLNQKNQPNPAQPPSLSVIDIEDYKLQQRPSIPEETDVI